MSRQKLLLLCQTLPYPPDGGVWIRTYELIRRLAPAFDITALCFERAGAPADDAARARATTAMAPFATVEIFALPQMHSRIRFAWDHARSLLCRRVYTTYLYQSQAFRRRLAVHLRATRFDLVHVDSLDLARYLPACADLPIVCVHHDVESDLLQRRADVEPTWWRRAYLAYQSRRMSAVERHWCPRISLNVVVSEADRRRLVLRMPTARAAVVPNGVDLDAFRGKGDRGAGIAFVGGTSPSPNRDALDYFCAEILPHVRHRVGAIPVTWIGRASVHEQRYYRERWGVDLTGYVEDVRPYMQRAACHIVPLRIGGGTRLKILNSWAMGKPVVSTSIGCEGLAARDGTNILIRDHPAAFASAISEVLACGTLCDRLARGGHATAQELYSWDGIAHDLIALYLDVAASHRAPAVTTDTCLPHAAFSSHQ